MLQSPSTSSNNDSFDNCVPSLLSYPALYNRVQYHVNHEKFSVHMYIIYVRNSYSSHSIQKYKITYIICMVFSFVSMQTFLTTIDFST